MADESPVPVAQPSPPAKPRSRRRAALLKSAQDAYLAGSSGAVPAAEGRAAVARLVAGVKAMTPQLGLLLLDKAARGKASPVDREATKILVKIAGTPMEGDASPAERARLEKEIESLQTISVDELERSIFKEATRLDNRAAPIPLPAEAK